MIAYKVVILILGIASFSNVKGQNAAASMVQIYVGENLRCGGTIYNNKYIITSGLCFSRITASTDVVNFISVIENAASPTDSVRHLVKEIIYSPTNKYEIALLKLETLLETPGATPITLDGNNIPDFSTLTSLNWNGNTIVQGPSASYYPLTHCDSGSSSQMCAVYTNTGSCTFPGGPILLNGKQVGVMLNSQNCARNNYDVFTRISSYIKWIQVTAV